MQVQKPTKQLICAAMAVAMVCLPSPTLPLQSTNSRVNISELLDWNWQAVAAAIEDAQSQKVDSNSEFLHAHACISLNCNNYAASTFLRLVDEEHLNKWLHFTEELKKDFPSKLVPGYLHADALFRLAKYTDAILELDRVIAGDPDRALAYIMRSVAHLMTGDLDRALEDADYATTMGPKLAYSWTVLAIVYVMDEDTIGAQSALQRALKIDDKFGIAHLALSAVSAANKEMTIATGETALAVHFLPELTLLAKNNQSLIAASIVGENMDGETEKEFAGLNATDINPSSTQSGSTSTVTTVANNKKEFEAAKQQITEKLIVDSMAAYTTVVENAAKYASHALTLAGIKYPERLLTVVPAIGGTKVIESMAKDLRTQGSDLSRNLGQEIRAYTHSTPPTFDIQQATQCCCCRSTNSALPAKGIGLGMSHISAESGNWKLQIATGYNYKSPNTENLENSPVDKSPLVK